MYWQIPLVAETLSAPIAPTFGTHFCGENTNSALALWPPCGQSDAAKRCKSAISSNFMSQRLCIVNIDFAGINFKQLQHQLGMPIANTFS